MESNGAKYEILFSTAIETWKSQVESYWTRTSYFAVFELALAAGLWKIFDKQHYLTSAGMAVGALALTAIWMINNSRLHEYILHYWKRVEHFEKTFGLPDNDFLFKDFEKNRSKNWIRGQYHCYIQIIPILFFGGWIWMLVWSIINSSKY